MRAIILAAGSGRRLQAVAGDNPKCLVRVGGRTLLERQIAALQACGLDAITVVAGFQAARVADACQAQASVLENARFAETNSLYSLWLAGPLLAGGFVVLNGDVLFHPQLLADLLCDRHDAALLVEYRPRSPEAFGDEEMKVKVRGGCLADIGKTLGWRETDGENVGLAKFTEPEATHMVRCLDAIVARGGIGEWAPYAFRQFARTRRLHAVGTRGLPWIEIDFPGDYERAEREVLPLLDTRERFLRAGVQAPALAAVGRAKWNQESGHV